MLYTVQLRLFMKLWMENWEETQDVSNLEVSLHSVCTCQSSGVSSQAAAEFQQCCNRTHPSIHPWLKLACLILANVLLAMAWVFMKLHKNFNSRRCGSLKGHQFNNLSQSASDSLPDSHLLVKWVSPGAKLYPEYLKAIGLWFEVQRVTIKVRSQGESGEIFQGLLLYGEICEPQRWFASPAHKGKIWRDRNKKTTEFSHSKRLSEGQGGSL